MYVRMQLLCDLYRLMWHYQTEIGQWTGGRTIGQVATRLLATCSIG